MAIVATKETPRERTEYHVPAERLDWLTTKIHRLANRARRLGCDEIGLEIVGHYTERETRDGRSLDCLYHRVVVTGKAPRIDGYEFIATLEHLCTGNLIRPVPNAELREDELVAFRHTDATRCDHCHRRDGRRTHTFLIREASGTIQQVGRNCLRNYLGHESPESLARAAELLVELDALLRDSDYEEDGMAPRMPSVADFLAYVAATIRIDGYLSRTAARDSFEDQASADIAWQVLFMKRTDSTRAYLDARIPTEADKQRAKVSGEHARQILEAKCAAHALSDYEHTLLTLLREGWIAHKHIGFAASILPFADKDIERRKREERQPSEWIGNVGKREEFAATLDKSTIIGNCRYTGAPKYLHRFVTADDNVLVWFTTRELDDIDTGDRVRIRATIKAHNEYRSQKQTTIARTTLLA